jgi:hypothetical protein
VILGEEMNPVRIFEVEDLKQFLYLSVTSNLVGFDSVDIYLKFGHCGTGHVHFE